MAMEKESIEHLEAAKSGQKRKFVMICSGDKVVNMIVFKSGTPEQFKKQVKEGGQGKFYFGEIKGKGTDLIFELARDNNFQEAPVGDQKLKAYLKDEARLSLAPSFEIVDEHGKTPVAATNADSVDSAPAKPQTAPVPPHEPPKKTDQPKPEQRPDPKVQKSLEDTLTKLGPLVKTAVQNAPERKMEILTEYKRFQAELNGANPAGIRDDLVKYGKLIKELALGKSAPGSKDDGDARKWSDAAQKWAVNKAAQMAAVKDTMNALGNLVLDTELDPDKVNALISELSTYVPKFEQLTGALDDALREVESAADPAVRSAAIKNVQSAIANLRRFCTGPRIQKLLADFDGKDFFAPSESSLEAISELAR